MKVSRRAAGDKDEQLGRGAIVMDEPIGRDLSADGADDRSAVLSLLNSDAWQRRLTEARAAREKILAERALAATPTQRSHLATVTRIEPLVLARPDSQRSKPALAPVSFHEPEFKSDDLPSDMTEEELGFDEEDEAADIYAFPYQARQEPVLDEEDEAELWEEPEADEPPAPLAVYVPPPAAPAVAAATALPAARAPLSATKIALGFAMGLAAGVAATSLVWFIGSDKPASGSLSAPKVAAPTAIAPGISPAASIETAVLVSPPPAEIAPLVAAPEPAVESVARIEPAVATVPAAEPVVEVPPVPAPRVLALLPTATLIAAPESTEVDVMAPAYARVEAWAALPAVSFADTSAGGLPAADEIAAPMPGVTWTAPRLSLASADNPALTALPALALPTARKMPGTLPSEPAEDIAPVAAAPSSPPPDAVPVGLDPAMALAEPPAADALVLGSELGVPPARLALAPLTLAMPDPPVASQLAPHLVTLLAPPSIANASLQETKVGLTKAGFTLGEPKRVGVTVGETHVRYYHPEDKAMAEILAARFGGEARDFSGSDGSLGSGNIEVWLEGSAPKVAKAKAAKKQKQHVAQKPSAPREDPQISALRERIVRNLQSASP